MTVKVKFEQRPTYLFAHVTGNNSADSVHEYMEQVLAKCDEVDCHRVLIHECLTGPRLSPMEVFDVVSKGSMHALGKFDAIAMVDEHMGEVSEFAETVAINRGMPIAMFQSLEPAEEWILRQEDDSDSQRIFIGDSRKQLDSE